MAPFDAASSVGAAALAGGADCRSDKSRRRRFQVGTRTAIAADEYVILLNNVTEGEELTSMGQREPELERRTPS
jgi:hypothetical protein